MFLQKGGLLTTFLILCHAIGTRIAQHRHGSGG